MSMYLKPQSNLVSVVSIIILLARIILDNSTSFKEEPWSLQVTWQVTYCSFLVIK